MKIRSKIILAFLVTLLPVILIGVLSIIQLRKISNPIINDIPQNMAQLSVTSELEGYASFIRYYDEILTQSARNYAFTGDDYWKNRYYEVAPKLDEMINLAIDKGDQEDKESFSSINSANLALIALEEESISLVSRGNKNEAINILEGEEYSRQKEIYKRGLVEFVERKGMNYDQAFSVSTQKLGLIVDNSRNSLRISFVTVIIAIFISIVLILFFSFVIASAITKPITKLENYAKNIESTDILEVINTQSKDEVGSLAKSFGNMVLQLRKSKTDVEETVKERTKDLEKLNQYLTGRELKMIELKEEIKKLKEKK